VSIVVALYLKARIELPKPDYVFSIASDLSNIALTLSGFILTLLTVLITFKGGSKITKDSEEGTYSVFDAFFATGLYYETVRHLKNCVKSLVVVSIVGYGLKLGLKQSIYQFIFFYNIYGLSVIILTLVRSLLILTRVVSLQSEND